MRSDQSSASAGPARDATAQQRADLLPRLIALPARLAPGRHAENPRAPFVVVTALALASGCFFFGGVYFLQSNWPVAAMTVGAGALAVGTVPLLRWLRTLTPAIHVLAAVLLGLLALTEIMVGGPNPTNLIFMAVIPIAALFAGGLQVGVIWLFLTWSCIAALMVAAAQGALHPPPPGVAEDPFGVPVVVGMVFGFAFAYDRLQNRMTHALEQARARAEDVSARRGDFLASMSHELRTPMNGVIGMTHALLKTPLSAEQRSMLQTIQGSGRSLVEVISDILDFERIDRGLLIATDEVVSPAAVAHGAARVVAPLATQANLAVTVDVGDGVPAWIRSDGPRLRQILVNLLGNAIKYTPVGSIRMGIAREGEQVCFRVEDTGPGVDPALIARLFQPFAQGAAHVDRGQGSGLGLAISRGLATLLGGTLELERAGPGAVFALRVPCREAAAPVAAPEPGNGTPRGHRILVVEDNAVNVAVARAYLSSAGATCEVSRNGEEALARIQREPFDLVLMDLRMPGLDGAEVTQRLRAGSVLVPIVAMTASVRPEDRERCMRAGMDDFLSKPITPESLARVLARFPPNGARREESGGP